MRTVFVFFGLFVAVRGQNDQDDACFQEDSDIPGGNIEIIEVVSSSFDCKEFCEAAAVDGCHAFVWYSNLDKCVLKGSDYQPLVPSTAGGIVAIMSCFEAANIEMRSIGDEIELEARRLLDQTRPIDEEMGGVELEVRQIQTTTQEQHDTITTTAGSETETGTESAAPSTSATFSAASAEGGTESAGTSEAPTVTVFTTSNEAQDEQEDEDVDLEVGMINPLAGLLPDDGHASEEGTVSEDEATSEDTVFGVVSILQWLSASVLDWDWAPWNWGTLDADNTDTAYYTGTPTTATATTGSGATETSAVPNTFSYFTFTATAPRDFATTSATYGTTSYQTNGYVKGTYVSGSSGTYGSGSSGSGAYGTGSGGSGSGSSTETLDVFSSSQTGSGTPSPASPVISGAYRPGPDSGSGYGPATAEPRDQGARSRDQGARSRGECEDAVRHCPVEMCGVEIVANMCKQTCKLCTAYDKPCKNKYSIAYCTFVAGMGYCSESETVADCRVSCNQCPAVVYTEECADEDADFCEKYGKKHCWNEQIRTMCAKSCFLC